MLVDERPREDDGLREAVDFLVHYVDFAPRDSAAATGSWGESPIFVKRASRRPPPPWLLALWGGVGRRRARRIREGSNSLVLP